MVNSSVIPFLRHALAGAFLVLSTVAPANAATYYVVKDLGALPGDSDSVATGINSSGSVVGWSNGPNGYRGFVYTDAAGMIVLPGLPDRPRAFPRKINDAGDIAGTADAGGVDLGHAVRWRDGIAQDLGTLPMGPYSAGWGINSAGDVAGESYTQTNGINHVHAFLYTDALGMIDLTPTSDTGVAHAINDAGQITGYKTASGGYHAFRWANGAFQDLGVLPGMAHSFGYAIEPGGKVAGNSSSASGNTERLFRFADGTGMQNLGGVGEHNTAWGINAAGTVVGALGQSAARAFVYTDSGGLQNLNDVIDASRGWVLQTAFDINAAGQIAAYGFNNFTGATHAVRLEPTNKRPPECSYHCLRSVAVDLKGHWANHVATVEGRVAVEDENGDPVPQALVVAEWALPDGTNERQYDFANNKGIAKFDTSGGKGTYTLEVINIVKSLYTFNPKRSVLSGSVNVP